MKGLKKIDWHILYQTNNPIISVFSSLQVNSEVYDKHTVRRCYESSFSWHIEVYL